MGSIDSLRGNKVALDTAPFIYYIEENPAYLQIVDPLFEAIKVGEIIAVTSIMSLLETLVYPIRTSKSALAQKYRDILLDSNHLDSILLSQEIAEEAARLRAVYRLHTPDSIQMATAIIKEATFFLTNDRQLPSLPNLKTLMLDDLKIDQTGTA
ncbi:MAG: type II toxin-antitoxin system VapC family toxin [Ktedonobacteraceae bacterium]